MVSVPVLSDGANYFGASESFYTRKMSNEGFLGGHAAGAKCKAGGDDSGQTFGYGSDSYGNSDFELINGLLERSLVAHNLSDVHNPNSYANP